MSDPEFEHLLGKARDAVVGGHDAWCVQSTGEKLAVALALNRADWLAEMHYTLAEAIDRVGMPWIRYIRASSASSSTRRSRRTNRTWRDLMSITARDVQAVINEQLRPGESLLAQAMWEALEKRSGSALSLEEVRGALADAPQFGWIELVGQRIRRRLS